MTNAEKYKDKITKDAFAVVKGIPTDCLETSCDDCLFYCRTTRSEWLEEEYEEPEPEVDWSAVEVDTPILVSPDGEHWYRRYFAKYENGTVYAWECGATSWSTASNKYAMRWEKYAKLAGVDE